MESKAGFFRGSNVYFATNLPTPKLPTLPETNIAPENGWLEYYFPIGFRPIFRGKLAVSFREGTCWENIPAPLSGPMSFTNICRVHIPFCYEKISPGQGHLWILPIGSMGLAYLPTFTITFSQIYVNIPVTWILWDMVKSTCHVVTP